MVRQVSTAVSDLFLAGAVFFVVYTVGFTSHPYFAVGLSIQGVAATFGIARFGMRHSERTPVFKTHKFFSWLAAAAGMPLVAYQFCLKYNSTNLGYTILIFSAIATFTWPLQSADNKQLYSQACSGLSLLSLTFLSMYSSNWYGVYAGVIYMVAGMLFGQDGVIFSIPKFDLLHAALVMGNLCFIRALS